MKVEHTDKFGQERAGGFLEAQPSSPRQPRWLWGMLPEDEVRAIDALEQLKAGYTNEYALYARWATRDMSSGARKVPAWLSRTVNVYQGWLMGQEGKSADPTRPSNCVTLAQLRWGDCFRHPAGEDLYVLTSWTRSGMSYYELAAVNLRTGAVYFYRPSKNVIRIDAKVVVSEDRR